ncbi:MAG: hypothetical protein Q4C03_03250 [bacterium]|nr:hypothetical protein [bacterium]
MKKKFLLYHNIRAKGDKKEPFLRKSFPFKNKKNEQKHQWFSLAFKSSFKDET